ncbi:amidohydrolase [Paenibacillus motobuensis]|uniref:amidohydrolase n=1 Tax=Paenibacillus TaxID=44249 RepID=UPI0020421D1B|nr:MULTISPECIES: amidohydrolase [Paenibacillus]MCM3040354.1 amidohydrolase [Paenibacillus lutimineralis]MCM3647458.1 amidohydrolase [Paenibacillus motobuensis]
MVERRRHLHRHPELSFNEKETSTYVAGILKELGIEITEIGGGYGLVGRLRGALPGKTIALRADMDALPIQDEKECEYASQVPGVMHACGHDGHTSVLLAVAEYYSERLQELRGEIRLLFQPAEETCPGGAVDMIEAGALEGVDVIYGVHLWTPLPLGTAASVAGPMMASVDDFFIDIQGRGGHGGMPHKAVDSVVAGSSLVMQLQSVVSRSVDPLQPAVVTIGSIQGGTAQNVIADRCRLSGTARCFDESTRQVIRERIYALVEGITQSYGTEAHIHYITGYPSLVNDEAEFGRFNRSVGKVTGLKGETAVRIMPAEDFAYYLQHVPGCFVLVGAGNEEKGIIYPHHHPRFDIDEGAMLHAAALMVSMAETYQDEH